MPSWDASSSVPGTTLCSGRSLIACMAVSTLMMLAGRCLPCGSRAAMTSPVSRSATSQASAETSPGTGGVPGAVTMPQPDSASPPIGLAGTGSGAGGSPTSGISDASTAGGVVTRYGQVFASTAAFGSAIADRGSASITAVTSADARADIFLKVAIVCAD